MKRYFLIAVLAMSFHLCGVESTNTLMTTKTGEPVWSELATNNVGAAKNFYGKVFGWQFIDEKMGDMTYTMIKKDGKLFGGIWAIPAQQKQIQPHWLPYILVEDIERSLEIARQNGATVIKPIQQAWQTGLFAVIRDPVGAHIALWQSLPVGY